MSESDYIFGTSILTSKSPQEAAAIIPNCLTSSRNLVEKCLLTWFNNYYTILQKQNQDLKVLYEQGSVFFKTNQNYQEFGNFSKTWNCLMNSLQSEIHANEQHYKSIRLDIIGPLKDILDKDVRYSELLINSNELQDISNDLANNVSNAEYKWNMKAPQSFENFENFKKFEKQMLFDIILNYFNLSNQRGSKVLTHDEDSVNYLVSNFKIEDEMNEYLKFLLKSEFQPVINREPVHSHNSHSLTHSNNKRLSSVPKHDNNSIISNTSSNTPKKSSKLKSRVGSIFGRKSKKPSKTSGLSNDIIPETASESSVNVTATNNLTHNLTRGSSITSRGTSSLNHSAPQRHSTQSLTPQQNRFSSRNIDTVEQPTKPVLESTTMDFRPLKPNQPLTESNESVTKTPALEQQQPLIDGAGTASRISNNLNEHPYPNPQDSPNIVRYDSNSSSGEDIPDNNHRLSMLQRHDLAPENLQNLAIARSNQSSPGKYSFVAGDDKDPINHHTKDIEESNVSFPEPTVDIFKNHPRLEHSTEENSEYNTSGNVIDSTGSHIKAHPAPPPPPPSRKVVNNPTQSSITDAPIQVKKNRRDVNSQIFHNLPTARDSIIPSSTLVSQSTGNSLLKNDYFKHFEASRVPDSKGLNSSIAEVINVTFKDSNLVKAQVIGEVAFNYQPYDDQNNAPESILIKIPNSFDKIILNNSIVQNFNDDVYKLNLLPIITKTIGGLKYLSKLDDSQVPILVQQIWKFEDHQASLMINLKLNPNFNSLSLSNLMISAALDQGTETTSASSRPQGSFSKEKNRITWRFPKPLKLSSEHPEERIIARFLTHTKGMEHENGIQFKFQINEPPLKLTKILNNDDLNEIPCSRNLTSGNYVSHY